MSTNAVVTILERPDLVPVVAQWLWEAFWRKRGSALAAIADLVAASNARLGPPQCFVLLRNGTPVGTASLVVNDLDTRPELTPWLAGVFVVPSARGRGYAGDLIRAVEAACRAAAIPRVWLYTDTAEGL